MNVLTLRTELETLLVDLLGVYRLGNNATTPAVSVRAVGESLPAKTTVSGLELVIMRDPELDRVNAYQRQEAFRLWTLYLVDWDGGGTTAMAAGRILYVYPGTDSTTLNVPESVGPKVQVRLRLRTAPEGGGET
jgi:hypothetical protein